MNYETFQKIQFERYEGICARCGECCGLGDGDACVNLASGEDGKFYCRVYENRLGLQKTQSGKIFTCIPIRELARRGRLGPNCAYNR